MNIFANSNDKQSMIIIPEVTKQKTQAALSLGDMSIGITTLIFILTHRAQIAYSLQKMKKQDIQQLPSVKWNAKMIAKSYTIRTTIAKFIIAETLHHQLEKYTNLSEDEVNELLSQAVEELATATPKPGAKLLAPRAINENNILSHRLALMAKYIGIFQAKPLYDPSSIIKNTSIVLLNSVELSKCIIRLHESLQIPLNESLQKALDSGNDSQYRDALREIINDTLFEQGPVCFDDGIDLTTEDNKFPLEEILPLVDRPKPEKLTPVTQIPIAFLTNPLFAYAVGENEKIAKENKIVKKPASKLKTAAKAKAPTKPRAKSKVRVEKEG